MVDTILENIIEQLNKKNSPLRELITDAFIKECGTNIDIIKYLAKSQIREINIDKIEINMNMIKINVDMQRIFDDACCDDYGLCVIKYVIRCNINKPINIYKYNYDAFTSACDNDNLKTCEYLLNLGSYDHYKHFILL